MKTYCDWMEDNPRWLKLILCIWILDLTWVVYRIFKSFENGSFLQLLLAILWIFMAGTVGWVLDVIWIIFFNHPFWFK